MRVSVRDRMVAYAVLVAFGAGLAPVPVEGYEPAARRRVEVIATEGEAIAGPADSAATEADRTTDAELVAAMLADRRTVGTALPDAHTTIELGQVRLEIPAGAVARATEITIEALDTVDRLNPGMHNATDGSGGYRFLPAGTRFARPVEVTLPVDADEVGSEAQWANLYSYWYDKVTDRWMRLERMSVDREARLVTSRTTHFTDMINSTLTLPESPEPLGFDPTAIKSIEAADPLSGIPALEGFEPSAYGATGFRLALRLPPGRAGATPQVALSYSSENANSWLGRGFDITTSSITIDTRYGPPEYDGEDTYLLDGQELVRVGGTGTVREYRVRTEREFARIRWHRGGASWWEVTGRDGVVREYGREAGWSGPDRGDRGRTFTWHLTRQRDPNGNTISYRYHHDAVGATANRHTYLEQIRYSGHGSGSSHREGPLSVSFIRQARDDRRSSARGRFNDKLAYRLERIEVAYAGVVFRRYVPTYRYDLFGQSQLVSFRETDGAGREFYRYEFGYYEVPERTDGSGNVIGYDAFGSADVGWGTMDVSRSGLGSDRTFTVGAGLTLGANIDRLRWSWSRGRYWDPIAGISVSGGVSYTDSLTTAALFDVNGDGITDAVWREGGLNGSFRAQLGTTSGFANGGNQRLDGLGDNTMTQSKQVSAYVGVSASALGASISATRTWGQTESQYGLSDINGDGFIDVVSRDSRSYRRNDGGTGFANTNYQITSDEPVELTISVEENDEYQRGYYLQQPLRRWKAPAAGQIEVEQTVTALAGGQVSTDGFVARSFAGNTAIDTIQIGPGVPSGTSTRNRAVAAGESWYFLLDTADNDIGDAAGWNVRIRYTDIELFAGFAQMPLPAQPPQVVTNAVPWGREVYTALYTVDQVVIRNPDPDASGSI